MQQLPDLDLSMFESDDEREQRRRQSPSVPELDLSMFGDDAKPTPPPSRRQRQQPQQPPQERQRGGFFSELGRGLGETALGAAQFFGHGMGVMRGDPVAALTLGQGVADTVREDVRKAQAASSTPEKLARFAAIAPDVLGIPATQIGEDIASGNYGHAAGLGLGAAALTVGPTKGPGMVRATLKAAQPRVARFRGARAKEPVAAAVQEPAAATVAQDVAAAMEAEPPSRPGGPGPRAAAMAEAEALDARISGLDPDVQQAQSQARGDTGPPPDVVNRIAAAGGRAQHPTAPPDVKERLQTPPRSDDSFISASELSSGGDLQSRAARAGVTVEEQLFRDAREQAHAGGYQGSEAALREEFNRRLEQAKTYKAEQESELAASGPRALFEAIAKAGGLRTPKAGEMFVGEVGDLWEFSKGNVVGKGVTKKGNLQKNRRMPTGELAGVSRVLRNDGGGLTLDGMAEALRENPYYANLIEGPNDLLVAIEDALMMADQVKAPTLESALGEVGGIRPDRAWWDEQGALTARRVEDVAGALVDEQGAIPGGDDAFDFGQNVRGGAADLDLSMFRDEAPLVGGADMPPLPPDNAQFPGGGGGGGGGREIPPAKPLTDIQRADESFISKLPEDVQGTLRELWARHRGFEDARREVQPLARTQALADTITAQPVEVAVAQRGRGGLAEDVVSGYDRLISAEREYQALNAKETAAKTGQGEQLSDMEWARLEELKLERALSAENVRGMVAEAGRSMRNIRAKVEEYNALRALQEAHDPVLLKEARAARASGYFRQYVIGNLVSAIGTHEKNFGGNLGMAVLDTLATAASGRPRQAVGMLYGMAHGLPRGLKEFLYVMRHGGSAFSELTGAKFYKEMPGGMLNPWNDVTRLLSATDRLFRAMGKQAEIDRLAFAEGLKGDRSVPLADRVAAARAAHPEWTTEADAIAGNRLFQDRLGKLGQVAIDAREAIPALGFMIAPFIRISSKLIRMNAAYSPAPFVLKGVEKLSGGRFSSDIAATLNAPGRAGELARARAGLGSALLAALVPYVLSGKVTGDGPRDPNRRALWKTNHQENSVWIPGRGWVSHSGWPALSVALSALANAKETIDDVHQSGRKLSDDDADGLMWNVLFRTINSITSASFLSGVEDFQRALDNPGVYAQQAGSRIVASTLTPLSAFQRMVTQTGIPGVLEADRTVRAPQGLLDTIAASTPGLSTGTKPLLDPFGEAVQRQQSPLTVGILKSLQPPNDPLVTELQRLNVPAPRPTGDVSLPEGLHLSGPQRLASAQLQGRERRQALEALILQNPGWWNALSPEQQQDLIRRTKTDATKRANDQTIGSFFRDALLQRLGGGQ